MSREMSEKLEAAMWRNWALKVALGAVACLGKSELHCEEAALEIDACRVTLLALADKLRSLTPPAEVRKPKPKPRRIFVS